MSLLEQESRPRTIGAQATARHLGRIAQGSFFLAAIFLVLLGSIFQWDPAGPLKENRRLAEFPPIPANWAQSKTWTDRFQAYFRDHFGFRAALINRMAAINLAETSYHPFPDVVAGKRGWYYFCYEDDSTLERSRGMRPLTEQELAVWVKAFRRRHAFMARLGIPFLIVIAPDKQTIYPEYLPDAMSAHGPQSRLEQFVERLRQEQPDQAILDLRPALLDAKSQGPIYLKTDTHWTDRGAYVGYTQILGAVRELLPGRVTPALAPSDFDHSAVRFAQGDLAAMMGATNRLGETTDQWTPRPHVDWTAPAEIMQMTHPTILDDPDPRLPRLVMFRDSFMVAPLPMFARHFSHGVYIWSHAMTDAPILTGKPDIVICEFVERTLETPIDGDSPAFGNTPIIPPK